MNGVNTLILSLFKLELNKRSVQEEQKATRNTIHIGIFQTLARYWIGKEISEKEPTKANRYAHIFKICVSSIDTISDISVAITLASQDEYYCALAVILVDCLPTWQVLLHGLMSPAWKKMTDAKEMLRTGMILVFAPVASPLFKLRLLWNYSKKSDHLFDYNHQNDKVSELITSSLESPLQLVLTMVLISYGKLPMPWNDTSTFRDSNGNSVNLGAFPAMFSLTMSVLSLITSSLDVAECSNWKENIVFGAYGFCNGLFRILSLIILLVLFRTYTICFLLPCLIFASMTATIRFDKERRKNFSLLTTFLVGMFLPVAVSAEPHKAQYPIKGEVRDVVTDKRMHISGKISMFTLPIILLFDLILLLMLVFNSSFKLSCELAVVATTAREVSIKLLYLFLLPSGVAAFMSAYILSTRPTRKCVLLVLGILSTLVLSLAVFTPIHIWQGNPLAKLTN